MNEKFYVNKLIQFSSKERENIDLTLIRIKKALSVLGNPQEKLKIVHVAGTNGKGSVCNMLMSILSNKFKVGVYTSPSVIAINERIKINNSFIPFKDYYDLYTYVDKKCLKFQLSFFEISTIVAVLYFLNNEVDIAIFEVGLGGKTDATNIFDHKLISIINKITYDHTNILGNNIMDITDEKCGIINSDDVVISYDNTDDINNRVKHNCDIKNSKLIFTDSTQILIHSINKYETEFSYKRYKNIKLRLPGKFQIYNACVVIETIDILRTKYSYIIEYDDVISGLYNAVHPCRIEWIRSNILLDGAHNPDGMMMLIEYLNDININLNNTIILFAVVYDKDFENIIRQINALPCKKIITNALDYNEVEFNKQIRQVKGLYRYFIDAEEALNFTLNQIKDDCTLLVTGSLYLLKKIRGSIVEKKYE